MSSPQPQTGLDLRATPGSKAGSRRMAGLMALREARRHPWRTVLVLLLIGLPVFAVGFGSVLAQTTAARETTDRLDAVLHGFDGIITSWPGEEDSTSGIPWQVPDQPGFVLDGKYLETIGFDPNEWTQRAKGLTTELPEGVTVTTVQSGSVNVTFGEGDDSVNMAVQVVDAQNPALFGPDKPFEVLRGSWSGGDTVAGSQEVFDALAAADRRANGRGEADVPQDRLTITLPDGGSQTVALTGDMVDRSNQYPTGRDLLIWPWEDRIAGSGYPALLVDANSDLGQAISDPEMGVTTQYLTGQLPTGYESYVPFLAEGDSVVFRPVVENLHPELATVFENVTGPMSQYALNLVPLGVLAAVVLAETGLVAGAAFAVNARSQRRSTALLSVTGAEPATIQQTMLWTGLVGGTLAALVGAGLGVGTGVVYILWARSFGAPFFPPSVPWVFMAALVAMGIIASVVAAWFPARSVAQQDAWASIKGVVQPRRAPSRTMWIAGLVLAGISLAAVVGATVWGVTIPTVGQLAEHGGTILIILIAGGAGLVVATLLLIPGILHTSARLGGRLPLPLRMAARDADRNRGRTVPVTVAMVAAAMVGALVLSLGSLTAWALSGLSSSDQSLPSDMGLVTVPTERDLAYMRDQAIEFGDDPSLVDSGAFLGGLDGALQELRSATSIPGGPRLAGAWDITIPVSSMCNDSFSKDCTRLALIYPEDSICYLPMPQNERFLERQEVVTDQLQTMTRQAAAACDYDPLGPVNWAPDTFGTSGIVVFDPDRPEQIPGPWRDMVPGLGEALADGKAVVFDPQLVSESGTVTLAEFTQDLAKVPDVVDTSMEDAWAWDAERSNLGDEYLPEDEMSDVPSQPAEPLVSGHPLYDPQWSNQIEAIVVDGARGIPQAIIPASALTGSDQDVDDYGVLAQFTRSVSQDHVTLVNEVLEPRALQLQAGPTGEEDLQNMLWTVTAVLALILVTVAAITTGLAMADSRRDQGTLDAIGAAPNTRRAMAAAQILVATLVGSLLGVVVTSLPVIGLGLSTYLSLDWVPWPQLVVLIVGVPLLTAAITWLVVPGRLSSREASIA